MVRVAVWISSAGIPRAGLLCPGVARRGLRLSQIDASSLSLHVVAKVLDPSREDDPSERLFETLRDGTPSKRNQDDRNHLILGDNLDVLHRLDGVFCGAVDLVYLDPPFGTGRVFMADVDEETVAYDDSWEGGLDGYVEFMRPRFHALAKLLSPRATVYVQCDHRALSHLKLLCDEVFGEDHFLNLITWRRQIPRGMKTHARHFPSSADFLLMYGDPDRATWNRPVKRNKISLEEADRRYMRDERGFFRTSDPGTYSNDSLLKLLEEGRLYATKGGEVVVRDGQVVATRGTLAVKYYREQIGSQVIEEKTVDNIWEDIPGLGVVSSEHVGYPTQKPLALLRRIIEASSSPGDVVADFFCGSGTTLLAAQELGRSWIGCDIGLPAISTAKGRLASADSFHPFVVLSTEEHVDL